MIKTISDCKLNSNKKNDYKEIKEDIFDDECMIEDIEARLKEQKDKIIVCCITVPVVNKSCTYIYYKPNKV